nr:MAG TPA: hypothetical protein [Caudoviricetes sp.]
MFPSSVKLEIKRRSYFLITPPPIFTKSSIPIFGTFLFATLDIFLFAPVISSGISVLLFSYLI